MGINIKELRSTRVVECSTVVVARSSTARDLVRQWNARQKEHKEATQSAWFKGKLVPQAEFFAYLENELAKGMRSRSAIAWDAGISRQTLANYIKKGKVQLFSAANSLPNGSSAPEPAP